MIAKSELAWTLADYLDQGVEPPARIVTNPELSEGEMMTADEVAEFIRDSLATLRILSDKSSPHFEPIKASYERDLAYLLQVGSLSEDDYNDLTSPANLHF